MSLSADQVIAALGLSPHPEGGFYVETFRSALGVESAVHAGVSRSASTAIYFLLRSQDFSALHRVRSDEVWHHYLGDPLELCVLNEGRAERVRLGPDLLAGQRPQFVVPAGVYQGARPAPGSVGYTLCGCTVAPGFEFRDFEMPARDVLLAQFPQQAELVLQLTRL
jgi:predicted cupin superfamily sugar epimerase